MSHAGKHRRGKIALITALMLTVLIGVMACALDVGWITMTKTQLHAASDASALAGGTELLPGLGRGATKSATQVDTAVKAAAVAYAAENSAGDRGSVFVSSARDITLGTGYLDQSTGVWNFNWGVSPYNAVRVNARRDVAGSSNGDGPLPLIFAPVLGHPVSNLDVLSTAVILPARGIRIFPGSNLTSELSPLAFSRQRWIKRDRAQAHFDTVLLKNRRLINPSYLDGDGTPLYFEVITIGNQQVTRQIFDDRYGVVDPQREDRANVTQTSNGVLEINIYPYNSTEGNFGTVDIGGLDNSTQVIKRQLEFGPSEADMSYYADYTLAPSLANCLELQGDTGISAGIENTLDSIIGQCRLILLYDSVSNPGNNALYCLVEMVGVRLMYVELGTNNKLLVVEPCNVSDPAGIPDYSTTIGPSTTFFTPLILAQ